MVIASTSSPRGEGPWLEGVAGVFGARAIQRRDDLVDDLGIDQWTVRRDADDPLRGVRRAASR